MTGRARGRRSGRGVLATVAGLLIASAAIRVAVGTGPAIAREIAAPPVTTALLDGQQGGVAGDPDLAGMLESFKRREAALDARETQIDDRIRALAIAEDRLDARLADLVAAEEALRGTLALADGASEDDLGRLTAVYEAMKPKEAAALFEQMAPEFAAGFLSRMRPDLAGGIMTGLSPNAAYSISVILAGRNALVPRD